MFQRQSHGYMENKVPYFFFFLFFFLVGLPELIFCRGWYNPGICILGVDCSFNIGKCSAKDKKTYLSYRLYVNSC